MNDADVDEMCRAILRNQQVIMETLWITVANTPGFSFNKELNKLQERINTTKRVLEQK